MDDYFQINFFNEHNLIIISSIHDQTHFLSWNWHNHIHIHLYCALKMKVGDHTKFSAQLYVTF